MLLRKVATILPALSVLLCVSVGQPQENRIKNGKEQQERIEKLIRNLGSNDFQLREEATKVLTGLDAAEAALKKALKSEEAEVRRRARLILGEIEKRKKDRLLGGLLERGRNGEIDRFIDLMVEKKDLIDDDAWRVALNMSESMRTHAAKVSQAKVPLFPRYLELELLTGNNIQDKTIGARRVLAESILAESLANTTVVCRGPIRSKIWIVNSIVLANGNITVKSDAESGGSINYSIIFCDGEVFTGVINHSIVIATGDIKTIDQPKDDPHSLVLRNSTTLLKPLKLFDPLQLGVEVEESDRAVIVRKILSGKPFAQGGMKEGDEIITFNNTPIKSSALFRKLVRRESMAGKSAAVEVKRDGKMLKLTVPLRD
jgi:hypothetical protein